MFDMSWGEVMVIGGVALIVIGPKDLPKALRTVGQMTSKVKRLAYEFQSQFNEAMREADLEDVKREVEGLNRDVANATSSTFNPIRTIRDELKSAVESKGGPAGAAPDPVVATSHEDRFFGETPVVEEAGPIHHIEPSIEPTPARSEPPTPLDASTPENVSTSKSETGPDPMPGEPAGPGLEPAAERIPAVREAHA